MPTRAPHGPVASEVFATCASAILINAERAILFQQRDDIPTIAFPNFWALPGGHLALFDGARVVEIDPAADGAVLRVLFTPAQFVFGSFLAVEFNERWAAFEKPEEWKPFIELNKEMAPQCPVITEKKEPLAQE